MPPSQAVSGHLLVRIKPAANLKFGRFFPPGGILASGMKN